jgi:hypothetical protein
MRASKRGPQLRRGVGLAVAVAGLVLTACGAEPPSAGDQVRPQPVTYFVADQTGSRAGAAYRSFTMRAAEVVVDRTLRREGHLVVVLVGGSEGETRVVHEAGLVPRGPNRVFRRQDAARQRAQTMASISAALTSTARGTDLFGTFHAVGQQIAARGNGACELFVVSDFLQTVRWNLVRMPLDAAASRRLVDDLRVRGLLPDLRRCAVFGTGLGASRDRISTQRSVELAAFWRLYFEAAHGDLRGLGPLLVIEPEGGRR